MFNVGVIKIMNKKKRPVRVLIHDVFVMAIKVLWSAIYIIPLCFFVFPFIANFPANYSLYITRASLPQGMVAGSFWILVNGVICIVAALLAVIFIVCVIIFIQKIESIVIMNWMSPQMRRFLKLEEYESPFKRVRKLNRINKKPPTSE